MLLCHFEYDTDYIGYSYTGRPKGLVINYGEGGYKMGKLRFRNFKLYAPPPPPQSLWLKLQAPVLKLPQNLSCSAPSSGQNKKIVVFWYHQEKKIG